MELKPVADLLKEKVADTTREVIPLPLVTVSAIPTVIAPLSFNRPLFDLTPQTMLKYSVDVTPLDLCPID